MANHGERTPQVSSRGSLTPAQLRTRERFEQLIGAVAPFLDLVLAVGDRISRIAEDAFATNPLRGHVTGAWLFT